MQNLDDISIHFDADKLFWINAVLSLVMYAVALEIRWEDFKEVVRHPRMVLSGVSAQFLMLPLFTLLFVAVVPMPASIALGLFLVAACPGGNVSNFFCMMAKGNVALSVSLTAVATIVAGVMIPTGFLFWSGFSDKAAPLVSEIEVDYWGMMSTTFWLLVVPLILGMATRHFRPLWADRLSVPLKCLSILIFVLLVTAAFLSNFRLFIQLFHTIFWLALIHNALLLAGGYAWGYLFGLPHKERKTISLETGIQNTGIGLILAFNFFTSLGGLQIIVAWWGIWHLVSGGLLAYAYTRLDRGK
jgi:BASS family bile acid:Na+ symporter